mgnify:CR=1 FL=1
MDKYYIITNRGTNDLQPLSIKRTEVFAYLKLGTTIYSTLEMCQRQITLENDMRRIVKY